MNDQPCLNVVAAVVVVGGDILCVRRGKGGSPSTDYKWEFPGGKIEKGETPEQALRRELREELDYDVRPVRRITRVTHRYPDFTIILDAWLCHADSRAFRMKEHTAFRWVRSGDLTAVDFAEADKDIIASFPADL